MTGAMIVISGALALGALSAACSSSQQLAVGDSTAVTSGAEDTASLRARIATLEGDARVLAKSEGCSTAAQCRTAPLGERPCGGPRTYLTYCAGTTDSVALFRKLAELASTEKRYNALAGLVSTCEFRLPPSVESSRGSCRAVAANGNRVP